jgi:hypothetical protein
MILYKKQLFDLEVKGQGPTRVIMVCDTLPYGHAPRAPTTLKSEGEVTSLSGADKREVRDNREKW